MYNSFLDKAVQAGLLEYSQAASYSGFLARLRASTSTQIPIHGLELHLSCCEANCNPAEVDFACLVEELAASHTLPWSILINQLRGALGLSAVWVEYDAHQWDPPRIAPEGLPLIYICLSETQTPKSFADKWLSTLYDVLQKWLDTQQWQGKQLPSRKEVSEWMTSLPVESRLQQFGLAFRNGQVQPRILFDLPRIGDTSRLIKDIRAPSVLQDPNLEAQILVAAVFPYPLQEMMGLEILADRCSLRNLRRMRQHPRLRGSRLGSLITYFSSADEEIVNKLSTIEGRSSEINGDNLSITLRGVNHLKIVLSKSKVIAVKVYVGEVNNYFTRSAS